MARQHNVDFKRCVIIFCGTKSNKDRVDMLSYSLAPALIGLSLALPATPVRCCRSNFYGENDRN